MKKTETFQDKLDKLHTYRKEAVLTLKGFLSNPGRFSIIVLGERGTGKSKWVREVSSTLKQENIKWHNRRVEANCGSLSKDLAESELFGYAPGMFTGSLSRGKLGLFLEAAGYTLTKGGIPTLSKSNGGGVLFLDEIHHLEDRIFAKLLTALQTESTGPNKGKFIIKRMGDSKEYPCEIRIIFGSNRTIQELKSILPSDFFDRIFQLVVHFPSLSDTYSKSEIKKEFISIFDRFGFKNIIYNGGVELPQCNEFWDWLYAMKFPGNYRDLENIGIVWTEFAMKRSKYERTAKETEILAEVKSYFEKFIFLENELQRYYDVDKPYKFYAGQLKYNYAKWAIYESGINHKGKKVDESFGHTGRTLKCLKDWLKINKETESKSI